jgi:ABC-type nitrate/sulfonate/bicarbonate transport system substrate-binding protein
MGLPKWIKTKKQKKEYYRIKNERQKEKRRIYNNNKYNTDPEFVTRLRGYQRKYYLNHYAKIIAKQKEWVKKNPEKIKQYRKTSYLNEKIKKQLNKKKK